MRALLLTSILFSAAVLALPAAASAGTVSVSGTTLTVTAAGGEANRVTVSRTGATSLRVADRVTTRAGAGCAMSGTAVVCAGAATTATEIVLNLGDQSDRGEISRSIGIRGRLSGGSGNDTLIGGGGPDAFDGGSGRDMVSYASRGDGVTVALNANADDGAPGEGDYVSGVEVVLGTAGNDVLAGGGGAERFEGGPGDDRLDGGGGNDTLVGGAGDDALGGGDGNDLLLASSGPDGADVFSGGGGTDRADYGPRGSGVVADPDGRADDGERPGGSLSAVGLVPAIAALASGERDNVLPDVESLRGGRGDDVLAAGRSGGTIEGRDGTDVVGGGPGGDRLDGGNGFDRVLARDGRGDTIVCGAQTDRAFVDGSDRPPSDCESSSRSFAVVLAAVRRTVADGRVPVRVTCPAQAAVRCVGAVRLLTVRRLRTASGRARPATLGAARFNAPAGTSVEVEVRVSDAGAATLARLGNATRVRAAARGRDEAGQARPAATRFILRG